MGIKTIGHFDKNNFPQSSLTILEKQECRIGVIAWSEWLNWRIFEDDLGILRKNDFLKIDFQKLRRHNNLDFLIVMPHWEFEFQHSPRQSNVDLAKKLLNQGIDLIVGHHPHVLQPILKENEKFCFFSLGNFNGPDFPIVSWSIKLGALLEVNLIKSEYTNKPSKSLRIDKYQIHSFFQQISNSKLRLIYLENIEKTLARKLLKRIEKIFS
jgi:hypothetical protein